MSESNGNASKSNVVSEGTKHAARNQSRDEILREVSPRGHLAGKKPPDGPLVATAFNGWSPAMPPAHSKINSRTV